MFNKTKRQASIFLIPTLAFTLAGCSRSDQSVQAAGPDVEKPGLLSRMLSTTKPVTIPQGTTLEVRLDQGLSSKSGSGSSFTATVVSPIVVDGKTVIPRGAVTHGRVVEAHEGGHLEGVSRLGLELDTLEVEGKSYSLDTNEIRRSGPNHKKRNWILIGGGTGVGALIGGIAGGGKGALIGSAIGAAGGTTAAYATGKKDVGFSTERRLTFRLLRPVEVRA